LIDEIGLPPEHALTIEELPAAASRTSRVGFQLFGMRALLQRIGADVLFAALGMAPLFPPCPVLLAVRDPSPHLASGQNYSRRIKAENALRAALVRRAATTAARVLFPSEEAARAVGDALRLPPAKRVVVYHGCDHRLWDTPQDDPGVLGRYGLADRPFLLFVSQLYRQKHPDTLIAAFAEWIRRTGDREHQLVFAGKQEEPEFARALTAMVAGLDLERRVRFLGLVPHGDLPTLYKCATAFVLPTSMETFGHPFVEAMAAGAPVLCAETPIAREICGDAAMYFPVTDATALAGCLERIVGDTSARARMAAAGRARARNFSWEREARETLALLQEIAGARRGAPTAWA
jgi:glycosyltransferase involved in cell wall biosynthesis